MRNKLILLLTLGCLSLSSSAHASLNTNTTYYDIGWGTNQVNWKVPFFENQGPANPGPGVWNFQAGSWPHNMYYDLSTRAPYVTMDNGKVRLASQIMWNKYSKGAFMKSRNKFGGGTFYARINMRNYDYVKNRGVDVDDFQHSWMAVWMTNHQDRMYPGHDRFEHDIAENYNPAFWGYDVDGVGRFRVQNNVYLWHWKSGSNPDYNSNHNQGEIREAFTYAHYGDWGGNAWITVGAQVFTTSHSSYQSILRVDAYHPPSHPRNVGFLELRYANHTMYTSYSQLGHNQDWKMRMNFILQNRPNHRNRHTWPPHQAQYNLTTQGTLLVDRVWLPR